MSNSQTLVTLFDSIHKIYDKYHKQQKPTETIVISVLFHECLPCVIDYIKNTFFYFKNYNIKILISCNELMNSLIQHLLNNQLTNISNHVIIVNSRPNDMPIWGNVNLFEQHILNYMYCKNNDVNFDYFWFSASNDIFIKDIDLEYMKDNIVSKANLTRQTMVKKDIDIFYNTFISNPNLCGWFKRMLLDKNTVTTLYNNNIVIKCNEMEGLVLDKDIANEAFDFYINNLYQKSSFKEYLMEEIFLPSYLFSFYNYKYETFTMREKWCKYDDLKNKHNEELYNSVLKNHKMLFCIKSVDRNYNNAIRSIVRNKIALLI